MKAVQVIGYGDVDQLQVVDVPVPSLKQGEVLVRVKACGINNTEIWMREGAYGTDKESGWRPEGVQFPRIPGSDITGEVVEVGSGVEDTMVGRRVILFPFTSRGPDGTEHIAEDMSFIGSEYDGGYAEYVVWPADLCFDMPLDSFVDSAVFTVSGLTAWHMNEQIEIQPGQTIVVTGASGGVGSFNVQIAANVHGANVFAIVGDLKDEAKLKELGASRVFSYRSERLAEEILEANGGQQTNLDFRTMYLKHITMYGSVLGTRAEFQAMLAAIEAGKVWPIVDRTFPLAEARDAQTYFKQRGKFGKIVLVP